MPVLSLTLPRPCGRGSLVDPLCGSTPQAGEGLVPAGEGSAGVMLDFAKVGAALDGLQPNH